MVWADMKAYIGSKFCRTEYELINAIAEYKKSLTPEKCAGFIGHLKKVIIKRKCLIQKLNFI